MKLIDVKKDKFAPTGTKSFIISGGGYEAKVQAPKEALTADSCWVAFWSDTGEMIATGRRGECYDAVADEIIGRGAFGCCAVCDRPPMVNKPVKTIKEGWVHGSCAKKATAGQRWLKGLQAPSVR
jgi:hypothetical protein